MRIETNTTSSIKAVIFDWGGVISTGGSPDEASINLSNHLGLELDEAKKLFRVASEELKRGKIDEEEFWSRLAGSHGESIRDHQRDIWIGWESLHPADVMSSFIEDLKNRGYKVAVLSNTFPQAVDVIRDNGGYDGFDAVVASSEVGYAKPDPEIYQLILQQLDVKGGECIFVDDQQKCLTTAKDLFGMKTVLATSPEQIVSEVNDLLSQ